VPGAITSGQAATASLGSAGSGPGTSSAPKGKPVKAATSPGAAPAKCTGPLSEIAIGTVGGQSGFIGAAVHGGVEAVKAWVAETNAKGGLACHPIVYYVADDGGDPAKNAALTQQMLEEHHVIAMIFSNNPLSSQGGKPILERAHVATIGSEGASDYFNSDPDFFPTAATSVKLIDASYAMMSGQLTPDQKAHLGALTCIEAALCSQFGAATGDKYATSNGMTLVFNAGATMVQPDYTSNCQSAKNAGVKALFVVGDSGMLSRTIRSCKRIDFNPVFASSPVGLAPSVSELPDLDGVILSSTTRPWTANDPQAQRYLSTLAKYVPGALPGGAGAVGWGSALVLEQAGKNLPVNPTKDDIYAGLWTIKNNNFNGYLAPLTYAKDKAAVYPVCWWPMVIRNKAWVALDNGAGGCHK
jgi:branched-chain amino acid transport system substrate-binding protein